MPRDMPLPGDQPVPIHGVAAEIGLGKTRAWREQIAVPLVQTGMYPVLAVPRHRLGDEVVRDLAASGISARVYRGRDALDPDAVGLKMCRDSKRASLISEALGSVSPRACKDRGQQCEFYDTCGYQRQQRGRPDVWVVPHQVLFRSRPGFIEAPGALGIDESFFAASLNGVDEAVFMWLRILVEDRHVTGSMFGTADLTQISGRVHAALQREPAGRIRRQMLLDARLTPNDLQAALALEWRRKRETGEIYPGMPIEEVRRICGVVAAHNQEVRLAAKFWELLIATIEGPDERSPWLDWRPHQQLPNGTVDAPAVAIAWRDDIHPSWAAPTTVMDATMPVGIVRLFFPHMAGPFWVSAPMPHTVVRQIRDRPMTASMLIPDKRASERINATRRNNVERVRRFLEVRADDVWPGKVLVICQLGLEKALRVQALPASLEIQHFNAIAGENTWSDVALLIVIGRTEPSPLDVEHVARVLFGAEIREVEPQQNDDIRYPLIQRGIRMRDGTGFGVENHCHPDSRAEEVRQAICEAGLTQAIGRGRGVNRTASDPLHIDILTNVVLPIEVDEVTTWDHIQPGLAATMRARGAVPGAYADMATAYPDLFVSGEAARKGLERENPGQTPIDQYLLGVCPGFLSFRYRHTGSRGPASTLLYDPNGMSPLLWLTARLGDVTLVV